MLYFLPIMLFQNAQNSTDYALNYAPKLPIMLKLCSLFLSKALSGGMRRRLSVAMAVIGNPDILILDEPTTGLDPASRRQVWEVIETVKEGRSVVRSEAREAGQLHVDKFMAAILFAMVSSMTSL